MSYLPTSQNDSTASCRLSLAPGFSRVLKPGSTPAVLTAFATPNEKPLKRLSGRCTTHTRLKPGANESGAVSPMKVCELAERGMMLTLVVVLLLFPLCAIPARAAEADALTPTKSSALPIAELKRETPVDFEK